RRHTRFSRDWSSDVCSSDLETGGIMHCFSGSPETAKECVEMNFMISLGGPVTFKNARQPKDVAKGIPLNHLLVETDAPYLAPHRSEERRVGKGRRARAHASA